MKIRWPAPAAAAVTALLVAGCGGAAGGASASHTTGSAAHASAQASAPATPPPFSTLVREMKSAFKHASSVRMTGNGLSGSGFTGSVDITMTRSGDVSGTVTEHGTASVTLLVTHHNTYFKLNAAFVKLEKMPSSACALMCGKWLEATAIEGKSATKGLTWHDLTGQFFSKKAMKKESAPPGYAHAKQVTVGGQPAWKLTGPKGAVLYVAAHGPAYILRIVLPSGSGSIGFTEWNTATVPGPPPASKVINMKQLLGG